MARAIFKDWFIDFGPGRAKMEGRTPPGLAREVAALFPDGLDAQGLPKGWTRQPVGALFDVSIGRTPPRHEQQHFVNHGQGLNWLSIKSMGDLQVFAFESDENLTFDAIERFRVPVVPGGTVVVSFKLT